MLKITFGKTSSITLAKCIILYFWRCISHLLLSVAMNYLHLYYIFPENNKVAFLAKSVDVLSDCIPGNVVVWYDVILCSFASCVSVFTYETLGSEPLCFSTLLKKISHEKIGVKCNVKIDSVYLYSIA